MPVILLFQKNSGKLNLALTPCSIRKIKLNILALISITFKIDRQLNNLPFDVKILVEKSLYIFFINDGFRKFDIK